MDKWRQEHRNAWDRKMHDVGRVKAMLAAAGKVLQVRGHWFSDRIAVLSGDGGLMLLGGRRWRRWLLWFARHSGRFYPFGT